MCNVKTIGRALSLHCRSLPAELELPTGPAPREISAYVIVRMGSLWLVGALREIHEETK